MMSQRGTMHDEPGRDGVDVMRQGGLLYDEPRGGWCTCYEAGWDVV